MLSSDEFRVVLQKTRAILESVTVQPHTVAADALAVIRAALITDCPHTSETGTADGLHWKCDGCGRLDMQHALGTAGAARPGD